LASTGIKGPGWFAGGIDIYNGTNIVAILGKVSTVIGSLTPDT